MQHLGRLVYEEDIEIYHQAIARLLCLCCLPIEGLTLWKAKVNFNTHQFLKNENPLLGLDMFANFCAGEICIANVEPVASRLEWPEATGFELIKNEEFVVVNEVPWPCHHVNCGQFFTVTEQGLMLKEQSMGAIFQQHLEPLSEPEYDQWLILYFNRLAKISGTCSAFKDGRQLMQQFAATHMAAAAPLAAGAPVPAAIESPGLTIASLPGAPMPAPVPVTLPIHVPMNCPGSLQLGAGAD